MRNFFLIAMLIAGSLPAHADIASYGDSLRITVQTANYTIIHFHDWSSTTHDARWKMITGDQNPFTAANNYAWIQCIDRASGKTIFKKPSPALQRLYVSPDGKYIAGISSIMVWNPYQLVVYSVTGQLIKRRHIAASEARLDARQLDEFRSKFAGEYSNLRLNGHVDNYPGFAFIDYDGINLSSRSRTAWGFLYKRETPNHLSPNFGESVTNWVYWYASKDELKFNYYRGKLDGISLNDPKGERFTIPIDER